MSLKRVVGDENGWISFVKQKSTSLMHWISYYPQVVYHQYWIADPWKSEIVPGLVIGRMPSQEEVDAIVNSGNCRAILSLVSKKDSLAYNHENLSVPFLHLPIEEGSEISSEMFHTAITWLKSQRRHINDEDDRLRRHTRNCTTTTTTTNTTTSHNPWIALYESTVAATTSSLNNNSTTTHHGGGGWILIHDRHGRGRSASIAAVFMSNTLDISACEAVRRIQQIRSVGISDIQMKSIIEYCIQQDDEQ